MIDRSVTVWWHGYRLVPASTRRFAHAGVFTIVGPSTIPPDKAPPAHQGVMDGTDLVFEYAGSWDHRPTNAERQAVLGSAP